MTTEISDVLTRAFGEYQAGYEADFLITDVSLTEHVDLESDAVLAPGVLLRDRFEIVELVQTAGMSHIYKAIDLRRSPEASGDIHVAIKMIRPLIASNDQARLSLQREAAMAQSLSHPNIIKIFDFDDHDGRVFLVMEWLEGESVNALLRRTSGKGVETDLARTVIARAAAGVQHAHLHEVVHADINPSNIFLTDTHDVKLLDFGVARSTGVPDQPSSVRSTWVTQTYASPEVLSGKRPVVEDDVFSFACVVYRLLSGKHPFGGTLSLVARNKGLLVEPIPGLSDGDWEVLRRALSYDRSDRPSSVGEFVIWGDGTAGHDAPLVSRERRFLPPQRMWLAAAAAVIIVVGGYWLSQRGIEGESASPVESTSPEDAAVTVPPISASEALVSAATQAIGDGQLVAPDDVNARALFRMALTLEPDNAEALSGLRSISNHYVQQAQEALNTDNPIEAYAAMTVAAETDSANPAIGIIEQLLTAKGDGELADARLAVTTGDLDVAVERLTRAEQYRHIDPASVQSLRRQIEERRQSDLLLDRLAAVDARIAADRLLLPEEDNAYALLLDLQAQYGDDQRLLAATERLGERLLTRAAFAIAAMDIVQASDLLDAVDVLGVLTAEVEAARLSLRAAESTADAQEVTIPQVTEEQSAGSTDLIDAAGADGMQASQIAGEQIDEGTVPAASASEPVPRDEAGLPEATSPEAPETGRLSLRELGITEYVAPTFPRGALRRNVSGLVEVRFVVNVEGRTESIEVLHSEPGELFSRSAVEAVSQWRFEPREEATRPSRITLRFDLAE